MESHADQKYIEALIHNDEKLLHELYEKYSPAIRNMVVKNSGTDEEASDLFQEVLIAIYQRAKKEDFRLTCPIGAYLHLLCKNRWINELNKKNKKRVTSIDDLGYNIGSDVFKEVAIIENQRERLHLLQSKLSELGSGCHELLQLNWSGHSLEEVAKKLNSTYGYIRKKKSECMGKLIELVKKSPSFKSLQW